MNMQLESTDKIQRVLGIYKKLVSGEIVSKVEEANNYGVNERSIQRDIDDIRSFMESEVGRTGIINNVIYDREKKGFRLEQQNPTELTNGQMLAICKILLDSRALLKTDMIEILNKLIENCVSKNNHKEILDLRKENQKLKEKLIKTESDELKSKKKLQQGEDKLNITYCIYIPSGDNWLEDKILETTWNSLFKFILPNLTASINNDKLEEFIESYIEEEINYQPDNPNDEFEIEIYEQEFLTIKMQMLALGLIIPVEKNGEAKWKISSSGYKEMIDLYSLKK